MGSINRGQSYIFKLRELLLKPYIDTGKEKVLFYLPGHYYFIESMLPLIFRYIQSEKETIVMFPSIQDILSKENVSKVVYLISELEIAGGKCYDIQTQELYEQEYIISFLCSEYSCGLPLALRKLSRFVVSLQVSPIYIHAYMHQGKFDEIFSEQSRNEVDYLICSEYTAGWICEKNKEWDKKILRFGYPKLDNLYKALNNNVYIPKEWEKRTVGKKVFLFTTWIVDMDVSWLELFKDKEDNKVAIWRPHPLIMEECEKRKKIEKIKEEYNIIIDEEISYGAAFCKSDALIAPIRGSVMVNYLYTGKPVCIYDREKMYGHAAFDYRQDVWYKSAYAAEETQDVVGFINMIERGEDLQRSEHEIYRKQIIKHFDGKVCERIYNFFETLAKGDK